MLFWFKYPKKQFNLILSLRKQKIIIKKVKTTKDQIKVAKIYHTFSLLKLVSFVK
jgi:hypothetical protein